MTVRKLEQCADISTVFARTSNPSSSVLSLGDGGDGEGALLVVGEASFFAAAGVAPFLFAGAFAFPGALISTGAISTFVPNVTLTSHFT